MNKRVLKASFIRSLPVLSGYMVLGMGYGILLRELGYGFSWALGSSVFVYAGAMQFVLLTMLGTGVPLISVAITTLLVNARHLFYGISMTEKYKGAGAKKPYLIFALTDETYSILCTGDHPEGTDLHEFAFVLSLMDQCYWVTGSVIGNLIGQALPFDTSGIEFSMTALFITVFVDQWLSSENHASAILGIVISLISLMAFGSGNFLIPAMAGILAALTLFRKQLDSKVPAEEQKVGADNTETMHGNTAQAEVGTEAMHGSLAVSEVDTGEMHDGLAVSEVDTGEMHDGLAMSEVDTEPMHGNTAQTGNEQGGSTR